MKRITTLLVAGLAACSDPSAPDSRQSAPRLSPSVVLASAPSTHIVWSDRPGVAVSELAKRGKRPNVEWVAALKGGSATLTAEDSAALVAAGVRVESNLVFTAVRATPSWGIDRIDQHALPLDNSYTPPNEGSGVHVYIIDTGLDITHPEFGGRASNGADFVDGTFSTCHYHATHVAGTVGGATVGVANQVSLIGVRVLDCFGNGTTEQVVSGVEWVTANAIKPAVANMSLAGYLGFAGDCTNEALVAAVCNSIASGVVYALAAANAASDACYFSPGSAAPALTVNASTISDQMSAFSNGGPCTDLFAPGSDVYSTMPGGGYGLLSGTSMATPHVAGHAAQVLSANPSWTQAQVNTDILSRATQNVIGGIFIGGTPNLLLYVGGVGGSPDPGPDPEPPPAECPPGTRPNGNSGKCRPIKTHP